MCSSDLKSQLLQLLLLHQLQLLTHLLQLLMHLHLQLLLTLPASNQFQLKQKATLGWLFLWLINCVFI